MAKKGMYSPDTMKRNLSYGNIAEAMFRLWYEKNARRTKSTRLLQIGYNPDGTVPVTEKPWLVEKSDPDFALVRLNGAGEPGAALYGVSINAQQRPYYIGSTAGGLCSIDVRARDAVGRRRSCPQVFDCHDLNPQLGRLWYNQWNVDNDYPRFLEKSGAVDVVLVTLVTNRPERLHHWLHPKPKEEVAGQVGAKKRTKGMSADERAAVEKAIWQYLKGGLSGCEDRETAERFLRYLEFSNKKQPVLTDFGIRWFLLSDILNRRVEWWLTASATFQSGRPPQKYCVPEAAARREADLVSFLAGVDVAAKG